MIIAFYRSECGEPAQSIRFHFTREKHMNSYIPFIQFEDLYKRIFLITLALAIAAVILGVPLGAALKDPVKVESGLVQGVIGTDPAVTTFKGIPYAAPPLGNLRWREPQPPASWQGVRKADQFSPNCHQSFVSDIMGVVSIAVVATYEYVPHGESSEDCLCLNVWTPAKSSAEKLPVLVWIHGGRYTEGSASIPAYNGEKMAAKGLVVVSINYRLGIFGYLAHPELSRESAHKASGNYGLLDQVAALRWVQKNIAAFGGDPGKVTIAGQSAGGGTVHFLIASPLAKGLFHRAIAQSGTLAWSDPKLPDKPMSWTTLAKAEQDGLRFAQARGASSIEQLRAMSWQQLTAVKVPFFIPVVDGWSLPQSFSETFAKGKQSDVPMLVGCNADENGATPHPNVTLAQFKKAAQQSYGEMAEAFFKLYPVPSDADAPTAQNNSSRDYARSSIYVWGVERQKASRSKLYTYYWDHPAPGPDKDKYGAFHTSEVPYVLNSLAKLDRPWETVDHKIAEMMSSYWANFAATGDPNGKGLPVWPDFDPKNPSTMELGDRNEMIPVAPKDKLGFFQQFFLKQSIVW
jgi:para-nitrobenzyl esterase